MVCKFLPALVHNLSFPFFFFPDILPTLEVYFIIFPQSMHKGTKNTLMFRKASEGLLYIVQII